MKRLVLSIGGGIAATLAGATVGFFLVGPEQVWKEVAGPADQGPVDFGRLQRSLADNDALAATPSGPIATPDLALPIYSDDPAALMQRLDGLLLGPAFKEDARRVDDRSSATRRRYVVRTRVFRFPDTLSAEAVPIEGGTALLLYSRSQLGKSDFGMNRKRLRTIARSLGAVTLR